jgi:hypothetical protein
MQGRDHRAKTDELAEAKRHLSARIDAHTIVNDLSVRGDSRDGGRGAEALRRDRHLVNNAGATWGACRNYPASVAR